MAKITIWRSNADAAKERCTLTDDELAIVDGMIGTNTGNIVMEVEQLPMPYVRALLEDGKLKPNHRASLALRVHGMRNEDLNCEAAYELVVGSPLSFGSTFSAMSRKRANCEIQWNGRWYPVIALIVFSEDDLKLAKNVAVSVTLGMSGLTHDVIRPVDPALFSDDEGRPVELKVIDVLERLGFRRLQTSPSDFNLRLVNAERLGAMHGTQVWVKSAVLQFENRFWFGSGLSELPLGTSDMPRRALVEASLETRAQDFSNFRYSGSRGAFSESVSRMPLVRLFSVDNKNYVFADVDDLDLYDYDDTSLSRLFLPGEMKSVLQKVFETPTDQLFGDLIRGKHGGVVILASGNPGVGKTLTAEVYAEMTHRPLYVLEFGELGTTVEAIEESLTRIFARVVRWRAVLQFDECEIFLSHRSDDLERSAIVGIFLRMLDYYEGLLFLTTNRPDSLDYAIRSRVMLRLEYPDLDAAARASIWSTMFNAAGLELVDGNFDVLGESTINGRQIRNLVRLARILYPNRKVTHAQVIALMRYGCR